MNTIPRSVVKALHNDVNAALTEVATKHGFTFIHKGMRFDDARVTGRMEFIKQGAETTIANRLGEQNGLDFKVGEAVTGGRKSYTVKGFTPRGKVIIEDARGKQYTAHSYQLKRSNDTGDHGAASVLERLNNPNGPTYQAVFLLPGHFDDQEKEKWVFDDSHTQPFVAPVPEPGTLLMLTQRLREYDALVRAGAWQRGDQFCLLDFPIRELTGRTMGIVGFGVLGRGVAHLRQRAGGGRGGFRAGPGGNHRRRGRVGRGQVGLGILHHRPDRPARPHRGRRDLVRRPPP